MGSCTKFQLSSWSRGGWKVCGSGGVVEHQATMSNSNEVALELLWVELSYVGVWQFSITSFFKRPRGHSLTKHLQRDCDHFISAAKLGWLLIKPCSPHTFVSFVAIHFRLLAILPSSASTQLNFNFNWDGDGFISSFRQATHPGTHTATHPPIDVVRLCNPSTVNTLKS